MRLGVNPDRGPMEPLPEGITCWGFQARQHPCPRPCSHSLSAGWVALMCLATQSKQQDHSPGCGGGSRPHPGQPGPPSFLSPTWPGGGGLLVVPIVPAASEEPQARPHGWGPAEQVRAQKEGERSV